MWLSGDTDAHKEAIEAMGGKQARTVRRIFGLSLTFTGRISAMGDSALYTTMGLTLPPLLRSSIDADALRRQVEELQAAVTAKTEQINALTDRINTQPDPQEAADDPQPQDKAAVLVDKLSALPNVTATVKGAQTAAPVVWLSGDTGAHKEAIEAMGFFFCCSTRAAARSTAAWYSVVALPSR